VVYARGEEPAFGSFLYFQTLPALNDYFNAPGPNPEGVVGGLWPELGYEMPVSKEKPLPAGKRVVLSDVYLNLSAELPDDEAMDSRLFLDLLAGVYRHLERPASRFHLWPQKAETTLWDLENCPDAIVKEHGFTYVHPYTAAEYPDSMVQLTLLPPLRESGRWKGKPIGFADTLRLGVPNFFDIELGTMRRYLPSVGDDKDPDKVDSWYMYHPLVNLARLAKETEDEGARELFLNSLPFAITVAHQFDYKWPVFFNIRTLEVLQRERKPDDPGQSDVGGLFAHVMLQAYELTGESLYLEEAKAAIQATRGLKFELVYQTNITSYGILACLWLWRLTGEAFYRDQCNLFLAGYFHNCLIWQSEIGNARHYLHFFGASALHNGPYMAVYECYESHAAFSKALELAEDDLPESARLLLTEFCKYTLSRAWYFYPSELPEEALATEVKNGHIDRQRAFPLEDLYGDGQPAGQIGQEIYGGGAAFALSTRAFHRIKGAPFLLFCEYPLREREEAPGRVSFTPRGVNGFTCQARLIPLSGETPR